MNKIGNLFAPLALIATFLLGVASPHVVSAVADAAAAGAAAVADRASEDLSLVRDLLRGCPERQESPRAEPIFGDANTRCGLLANTGRIGLLLRDLVTLAGLLSLGYAVFRFAAMGYGWGGPAFTGGTFLFFALFFTLWTNGPTVTCCFGNCSPMGY